MTKAARLVLADCAVALRDFSESANKDVQRPRWLAVITLLRTVLDVLEEVDGAAGTKKCRQQISEARKELFKTKPEPRIFHEFIEDERNDTVHEYRIRVRANVRIKFSSGITWAPVVVTPHGGTAREKHEFVMREGPYTGQDALNLCREAIEFWRGYLDRIDEAVRKGPGGDV